MADTKTETRTAAALLDFKDVQLTYPNGTIALSGVDLTVKRGEFVTVVGPSGCGKSTLLRIASGLESATTGTTHVATDHVGYVFQDATLLPWRTVRANVELLAELRGHAGIPAGKRTFWLRRRHVYRRAQRRKDRYF